MLVVVLVPLFLLVVVLHLGPVVRRIIPSVVRKTGSEEELETKHASIRLAAKQEEEEKDD